MSSRQQCTFALNVILLHLLAGLQGFAGSAEIKVPVWVKSVDGEYATGFSAENFQARLEDQPARVAGMQAPGDNLVVLVVMDVVGDLNRIEAARNALIDSLAQMGPQERVAVLKAQDGLQVMVDPTRNRDALRQALLSGAISGFPGLLESLEDAASIGDSILQKSDVRVAVLYVTDGSIYDYRGDYTNPVINPSDSSDLSRRFRDRLIQERISRALNGLKKSWTPLFFLHLENRNDSLNVVYQNGITQFAETTGGEALFCNSVAQVPTFLDQLMTRIRNLYTLTLKAPENVRGVVRVKFEAETAAQVISRSQFTVPEATKPD